MILSVCATTAYTVAAHTDVLTDSATVELKEVKVTAGGGRLARIDRSGAVTFGRDAMEHAPRMFGEGDALRFMLAMPGVSAVSDYSGGASIDGMGFAQNEYRLNGIPVHFPYHFGGIFSVFNPAMYDRLRVGKSIHGAGETDVTGGTVVLSGGMDVAEENKGEANLGMIASSGFLTLPVGQRFSAAVAGRISYLNLLYGPMLRDGHMDARYGFGDADASVNGELSDADRVRFTFHFNRDNMTYDDRDVSLVTAMIWSNILAGCDWRHEGDRMEMDHNVWFSRFANDLELRMDNVRLRVPSAITEGGARGSFSPGEVRDRLSVAWGYGLRYCRLIPQRVKESIGVVGEKREVDATYAAAGKVWGEASYALGHRWRFTAGIDAAMVYGGDGYCCRWVDPRVSVMFGWNGGNITAHAGRYHQWLHQVGFSEMGMPSDFKLGPSRKAPVERGTNLAMAFSHRLSDGLSVTLDGFYKQIDDEPEYRGAVLDILNSDYRAENYIYVTRGYNAGGNLALRIELGRLSAMATYGYCIGKRRIGDGRYFNASSVLNHTATLSGVWRIDNRWSLSGVMNIASGRPYTPVKAIYFIGERIMMEYGERNSARLPLYHRLDIGADYEFHTGAEGGLTHKINLSVVNVYGRRNVEMSTFTADLASGRYMRRDVSSLYRMLPSVSYTVIW
ncbi:MAG: TonB-dependent receptor [Bacteroidales bacterium]|nr:TonB-dependent receptor [Bacteroidales bacterium]